MRKLQAIATVEIVVCGLVALLAGALPLAAAPATAANATLQADMASALQKEGLAGAVWAMVTPSAGTSLGAAGLKHAGSGAPMTADTRMQAGSVAKTVLAAGVLRLITEGRLSLDTPVAQLLPALRLDNRWSASDPVRVGHLLAHTAGLDNLRFWHVFSQEAQADTPLRAAFTRNASVLAVGTRPGSRYAYSNIGYGLLGMVVEAVTGERYERYLDRELLLPLGMRDSTFAFVAQQADARLAMGHFEVGAAQPAVPLHLRAAGQFTTTAADMATFMRFLMGDGHIDGRPFIAPALLAAQGLPSGTEAALAGLSVGHGLVSAVRDRHGAVGYCHPGTTVGFRAMLCVYPRQGKGFFVAINADSETADYERLNVLLMQALALKKEAPALPGAASAGIAAWQGIYVPTPSGMSNWAWTDYLFNFVRVGWDGASLRVAPFQRAEKMLAPMGGLLFKAGDRIHSSHALLLSKEGARILSDGLHSYERVALWKIAPLWISLAAGVAGLAYLLLSGMARLLTGRLKPSSPVFIPFLAVAALALPAPLFYMQSFLRLGDFTAASALLAAVTAALPLAMAAGLVRQFSDRAAGLAGALDGAALLAAFQCLLVLAVWGMLPFMLWR